MFSSLEPAEIDACAASATRGRTARANVCWRPAKSARACSWSRPARWHSAQRARARPADRHSPSGLVHGRARPALRPPVAGGRARDPARRTRPSGCCARTSACRHLADRPHPGRLAPAALPDGPRRRRRRRGR